VGDARTRPRTEASQRASQKAWYQGTTLRGAGAGGGGGGVYGGSLGVGKPHWLPLVTTFS